MKRLIASLLILVLVSGCVSQNPLHSEFRDAADTKMPLLKLYLQEDQGLSVRQKEILIKDVERFIEVADAYDSSLIDGKASLKRLLSRILKLLAL